MSMDVHVRSNMPVAEPVPVEPRYADGLLTVVDKGDVVWLVWYRDHPMDFADAFGSSERRPCDATVLPKSAWLRLMADKQAGKCDFAAPSGEMLTGMHS